METTRQEKNRLLLHFDKMAWSIANRCGSKNEADIDEVHNTCLFAISRAIDAWDESFSATLSGYAFRYAEKARLSWYKMNMSQKYCRQRVFENSGCELNEEIATEDEKEIYSIALGVILDRALTDGVINKNVYRILRFRSTGLNRVSVAEKMGCTEDWIGKSERKGIKKIRETYAGRL